MNCVYLMRIADRQAIVQGCTCLALQSYWWSGTSTIERRQQRPVTLFSMRNQVNGKMGSHFQE
jgi:hypothetical protein